jgi:quercetin dioxygenase-like cupin family protein
MADQNRPKPLVIVQTQDVRVAEFALAPGDGQPWHHHSAITDTFYGLEGLTGVEVREPAKQIFLRPGEKFSVPPNSVHRARNAHGATSRYLLVQSGGTYDFVEAK